MRLYGKGGGRGAKAPPPAKLFQNSNTKRCDLKTFYSVFDGILPSLIFSPAALFSIFSRTAIFYREHGLKRRSFILSPWEDIKPIKIVDTHYTDLVWLNLFPKVLGAVPAQGGFHQDCGSGIFLFNWFRIIPFNNVNLFKSLKRTSLFPP